MDGIRPIIGWLVTSTVIDIILKLIILYDGRWKPSTRWLELAATSFGLYVLYLIISSPVIATIDGVTTLIKLIFSIVMIMTAISTVIKLMCLLWNGRFGTAWEWHSIFAGKATS